MSPRLTKQLAGELLLAIDAFQRSYAGSPVTIADDLDYWMDGDAAEVRDPTQAAESRRAIEAALPEFRTAARRILDLLGEP